MGSLLATMLSRPDDPIGLGQNAYRPTRASGCAADREPEVRPTNSARLQLWGKPAGTGSPTIAATICRLSHCSLDTAGSFSAGRDQRSCFF